MTVKKAGVKGKAVILKCLQYFNRTNKTKANVIILCKIKSQKNPPCIALAMQFLSTVHHLLCLVKAPPCDWRKVLTLQLKTRA